MLGPFCIVKYNAQKFNPRILQYKNNSKIYNYGTKMDILYLCF